MKLFKVAGEIEKNGLKTHFVREIVAAKSEHAVEHTYAELGSKHRVKRFHITITKIEEIPFEEVSNPSLRKLIGETKVGE